MRRSSLCSVTFLAILLLGMSVVISGCGLGSTGGSSGSGRDPYPPQDVSGVWYGWIGPTFAVGIITTDDGEAYTARFIGNERQFITPIDPSTMEELPLRQVEYSAVFEGVLDDCSWHGQGYADYRSFTERLSIFASAATKKVFGVFMFSGYSYLDRDEAGPLAFFYTTTSDVAPDVNDLAGRWRFENTQYAGNTMALTITPVTAERAGVAGQDTRGNTFDGTIEIRYSPPDIEQKNIYDVSLRLNNLHDLKGLAAYVLEVNTMGVTIDEKTLALGVTNAERTISVTGLGTQDP